MENTVIRHDQSKKNRFSIKTPEPQIKQKKTDLVKKTSSGNTARRELRTEFPLLGNLSLDWEFQHPLGKIWGIEESRDFLGKWHFLG